MAQASQDAVATSSTDRRRHAARDPASVAWLEGAPRMHGGVTFGVPWPRGEHVAGQAFRLRDASGEVVPLQTWATATWPDGSLKWTAHALPPTVVSDRFTIEPGEPANAEHVVRCDVADDAIEIDTGLMRCRVNRSGASPIAWLRKGNGEVLRDGRLICLNQNAPTPTEAEGEFAVRSFESRVTSATLEQAGPVRAVVKLEGVHSDGGRDWLPFVLRLYLYAGGDAVRVMHSFVFDGDEQQDFIRGLGLRFDVPMRDELHDRHVRFAGQDRGLFGEAVRGITGLRRDPGAEARRAQVAGEKTPPASEWDPRVGERLELIPAWGDYTLAQLSADGYQIRKRTDAGHGWIDAAAGGRAGGAGYVGGATGGGVAFGLRDFWQSHPSQLDVREAETDQATVTVWLWSPDAPAMDLRFYHDGLGQNTYEEQLEGLNVTYEDYEPGFGTPHGIARTSELHLMACEATPSRERMADFGEMVQSPPMLACAPAKLVEAEVFGKLFSLPDRSTPETAQLEEHLDYIFRYYHEQRENQRWYGFWNYGDVMHTYDPDRNVWRYDIGGYAWANSELSPDLWLWYDYLRSGRADVFRFAEAMTRHTGEVDVYHLGRFKHLGTRHNVQHWGCSAKQMRISTAIYRRIYYYLTADERVGDLMRELNDVVEAAVTLDPVRKVRGDVFDPRPEALSLGTGTDFSAVAAAWLTEWERTGDAEWKDKLTAMCESIGELPNGFFSPATFNMHTSRFSLYGEPDAIGVSHLSAVFGLVEVNAELIQLLDLPKFKAAWLQYCRLYNASREEQAAELGRDLGRRNLRDHHSRLTAYAAEQLGDRALARRAWREFFEGQGYRWFPAMETKRVEGPDVLRPIDEDERVSTNWASQYGLSAIQCLALVPESIDDVDG